MDIPVQRINCDFAPPAAGADDGDFAIEWNPLFVNQLDGAHFIPGALRVDAGFYYRLALAVIAPTPRFDDTGKTDFFQGALELGA